MNDSRGSRPGFGSGLGYLAEGWKIIRLPGIRKFVWIPLLINIAVFAGMGWLTFGVFQEWLGSFSLLDKYSDWWIVSAFTSVIKWLAGILLLFIFTYAFTLLANFIGAPFNSFLAEQVEAHLTGVRLKETFDLSALLKSIPATMGSEIRKLLYLIFWMIPLLLLHLIPVVNIIAPFLLFAFGAWMFAVEYVDHPMGNHGFRFTDVRRKLRQRRRVALGFGLPVSVLSMIPIVNLIVMPLAVASATILYVRAIKDID